MSATTVNVPLHLDVPVQLTAPTRAAELLALPVQTTETAAELLQISESSIRRLIESGDLRTVRIGWLVRIPTDQLIAWLAREAS